jgi:hypothetical protein
MGMITEVLHSCTADGRGMIMLSKISTVMQTNNKLVHSSSSKFQKKCCTTEFFPFFFNLFRMKFTKHFNVVASGVHTTSSDSSVLESSETLRFLT